MATLVIIAKPGSVNVATGFACEIVEENENESRVRLVVEIPQDDIYADLEVKLAVNPDVTKYSIAVADWQSPTGYWAAEWDGAADGYIKISDESGDYIAI